MEQLHVNKIVDVIYRLRRGESLRAIARDLSLARNTVKKYRNDAFECGFLDLQRPLPTPVEVELKLLSPVHCGRPASVALWLEDKRALIESCLREGVEVAVIFQRLQSELGYSGSYSTVCRFAERLTDLSPNEVFCRIETKPGEVAQVDFGYAGQRRSKTGEMKKTWFFVMTLSWSRHQYVEFTNDQSMETWIGCHERAFKFFGGVAQKVVIDNLKAGVLEHLCHDPVLSEPYKRLARHHGFCVSANKPRTPNHKGKVESGVHYVKRNFLAGREFVDIQSMNEQVVTWINEHAGLRIHGTTKEQPIKRFEDEKKALSPLPTEPFEWVKASRCKVGRDCHITVEGSYYSVPWKCVGQTVDVYIGQRIIEIYLGTQLLHTHQKACSPGHRVTRNEHYPESKRYWLENPPERCVERAKVIGGDCHQVVTALLSDKVQDRLPSVHSLLGFGSKYGKERLESACRRALHYGDPSYRRIKTILAAGHESAPITGDPHNVIEVEKIPLYARSAGYFFSGKGGDQ